MRTKLSRARLSVRPNIPETLNEMRTYFQEPQPDGIPVPGSAVYAGSFTDIDDNVGLIFMSNHSRDLLSAAREIFVDCTFKVVPRRPLASQLLTLHIKYMNTVSI